jgi:hypothetical protein
MKCRFGKIEKDEMVVNQLGMIAQNEWAKLPERFPNFESDVFQIMPNHIHGIILLNDYVVRAGFTPAQFIINNDSIVRAGFTPAHLPDHNHEGQPQGKGQPQGIALTKDNIVRAGFTPAQNDDALQNRPCVNRAGVNRAGVSPAPTIGDIVGSYKSLVSNECLKIYKSNNEIMGKLWQLSPSRVSRRGPLVLFYLLIKILLLLLPFLFWFFFLLQFTN